MAPGKNMVPGKNMAPGKNMVPGKNMAPGKNKAPGKNIADAKSLAAVPYCLGSPESATADISLVLLMGTFSSLLMLNLEHVVSK
jgi:hypothetical protein